MSIDLVKMRAISRLFSPTKQEASVIGKPRKSNNAWIDLLWLSVLIAIIYFLFLGSVPLLPPDEGRYAEIAREMLVSHQYAMPHLDGILYFEKPPLSYWINALLIHCLGASEWGVRSGVAIMGLSTCVATYFTAAKLFNRRTGLLSASVLSSSLLFFMMSHIVTTDMPLTFFLTMSLYAFLLAFCEGSTRKKAFWFTLAFTCSGLAMLTKGLIGIVFPSLIIGIWIFVTKQWQQVKLKYIVSWGLIISLINIPWLWFVQAKVPAFLHFHFIDQQIARYATTIAHREMSFVVYCLVFLIGLFPWITWLPLAVYAALKTNANSNQSKAVTYYLLIWPTVIWLFFAGSRSILIPYLLPIIPPLAILIAEYFNEFWQEKLNKIQQNSMLMFSMAFAFLGGAMYCILRYTDLLKIPPEESYRILIIIMMAFLSAGIGFYARKHWRASSVFFLICMSSYGLFIYLWSSSYLFTDKSVKPLALQAKKYIEKVPSTLVVNYGNYHQDLPYYLEQLVEIVDWKNELTFGFEHQLDVKLRLVEKDFFALQWQSKQPLLVLISKVDFSGLCKEGAGHCYIEGDLGNNLLIANQPHS